MQYVDGFVTAVPADNKDAYSKHAKEAAPLFRQFGAVRFMECWGEAVERGEVTDFYRAVKAEPGEVIVFSWVEYETRAARDEAGRKMETDEAFAKMGETMPFDATRMIYGGFEVLSDAGPGGKPDYIDGAVIAVPTENRQLYTDLIQQMSALLIANGALRAVDCWGDDVPEGKTTDFRRAVNAGEDESVVFSWVEWPSRAARDAAWDEIYKDPSLADMPEAFDMKRMIFGGFQPIVEA
ncbi:hypothetical protein GCM10007989_09710 [Devosia pacifica]|uniref:DUF1428 domain-containing protein n=1 Tax=Devosia pacifica TaxID=1335967 RepID=A0A918RXV9_9HYPH|nr:DUF1428 domain-containing protein [Devosia pacifica]GHA16681.1 hypothetical protein GCM10007989_09710 [Devosia pacifica]